MWWEIRPLATPKRINRSSPKVAYVIMSRISTHMQNLVTIPQGVSFPVCAKVRIKNVYSASFFRVLQTAHSPGPEPIFTQNTSNDVVLRKDVPFRGQKKTKKLTFNPPYSPKNRHFWARFWRDLENFRPKTVLQLGCSM